MIAGQFEMMMAKLDEMSPPRKLAVTESERRWVTAKWAKIRESQHQADLADKKWKETNTAINEKLDAEGVFDVVQRDKIKSASLALKDALGTGGWHARNAERHIHDVQLFLRLKELDLL